VPENGQRLKEDTANRMDFYNQDRSHQKPNEMSPDQVY